MTLWPSGETANIVICEGGISVTCPENISRQRDRKESPEKCRRRFFVKITVSRVSLTGFALDDAVLAFMVGVIIRLPMIFGDLARFLRRFYPLARFFWRFSYCRRVDARPCVTLLDFWRLGGFLLGAAVFALWLAWRGTGRKGAARCRLPICCVGTSRV